jgi:DNA modification methylase
VGPRVRRLRTAHSASEGVRVSVEIIHGNALDLPIEDCSVDLIVTSPPYFGLRSYQDGGKHYDGQIGDEPTPGEFVDALIAATREMVRVLKPSGSIWVNLGDKYGIPPKSLIGVPWRYAIRCIDDLGLILRAEVIWSKPNGLPESVTDRVRRSHETWFHFATQPRYFSNMDEVREPHIRPKTAEQMARDCSTPRSSAVHSGNLGVARGSLRSDNPDTFTGSNPLGKLPSSVWMIPTQPLQVPEYFGIDHFAAFPMEWPRRIIKGWCPPDGRVLDPFGGTGTTALVAHALGRHGISVDLSSDYCRLARWRTSDPAELARALEVEKPPKQVDGQAELFGGDAA